MSNLTPSQELLAQMHHDNEVRLSEFRASMKAQMISYVAECEAASITFKAQEKETLDDIADLLFNMNFELDCEYLGKKHNAIFNGLNRFSDVYWLASLHRYIVIEDGVYYATSRLAPFKPCPYANNKLLTLVAKKGEKL